MNVTSCCTIYFICLTYYIVHCQKGQVEDKCNFIDSKLQPNTFRLLSKTIVPSLDGKVKGDAGKICIIGGSTEYTGAPYFSAITALKAGADLVYVITTESAAPIIKSYSPDLIVYPFLKAKTASNIRTLLPKMHAIVIGPGLGRDEETLRLIFDIIEDCKRLAKPLIIDADGLWAISKNSSLLKNYPCPGVIMTPNHVEAKRLMDSITSDSSNWDSTSSHSSNWYNYWGDCISVLVKGEKDYFYSKASSYMWAAMGGGSGRRAAGQGDILSGALGTFYNWALKTELCKNENNTQLAQSVAAYAAAKLTRLCNYKAYTNHGRSMIASDMIKEIHPAFDVIFSGA